MMRAAPGSVLQKSPLSALRWVRDLLTFDGPLLAEFRNHAAEPFIFSWCDRDEQANRWLAFRIAERDLIRFTMRRLDLRSLVSLPADGFVYVVDIDGTGNHIACTVLEPSALPQDYLPDEGSVLPLTRRIERGRSYAVLLEGDWDTSKLFDFPHQYEQAYLAIFAFGSHKRRATQAAPAVHNYPWKGGYSAMHFYNQLYYQVPSESRPEVQAFAYASPGYVKWSLDVETANALRAAILGFVSNKDQIERVAKAVYKSNRDSGLNKADAPPPTLGSDTDLWLGQMLQELATALDSVDVEHLRGVHGPSNFVCMKIALSIYQRLRFLSEVSARGLVEY